MTGIRGQRTEDITSHLAIVFGLLSGMASCSIRGQKPSAVLLRADQIVRLGIGLYKCGIIAVICLLSSVFCPLAAADGISVNKAEIRRGEDGYQLSANYDINLTFAAQQSLTRGI